MLVTQRGAGALKNFFKSGDKVERLMLWANLSISGIILCGLFAIALFNYNSSRENLRSDAEHVALLTSERICNRLIGVLAEPINISVAMSNDAFLHDIMEKEHPSARDEARIFEYLKGYKEQYSYATMFLVSSQTSRYYTALDGFNRYLNDNGADDSWYENFIGQNEPYELNIDYDYSRRQHRELNVYVNTKVFSTRGSKRLLGALGAGVSLTDLQLFFANYNGGNGLTVYLLNRDGVVELSSMSTYVDRRNLLEEALYAPYKEAILNSTHEGSQTFWYDFGGEHGVLTAMYVPLLKWHMVVKYDIREMELAIWHQLALTVMGVIFVAGMVLILVSAVSRAYNLQIIEATKESTRWSTLQKETVKMYDGVYEVDLTNDRVLSDSGKEYASEAGMAADITYDAAIKGVIRTRVKKEYRRGYAEKFLRKNLLRDFGEGKDHASYEFQATRDNGATYFWVRLTGHMFTWSTDATVHMLLYNQNVTAEKQREAEMEAGMRHDGLSGLLNKVATQEQARQLLANADSRSYAFFIVDIDNFKHVNDTYGHAVGDEVIASFAHRIRDTFRAGDIVGRIGGDEFAVIIKSADDPHRAWLREKARALSRALTYDYDATTGAEVRITASIGVATSPHDGMDFESLYKSADTALYYTKRHGKNGFTVYGD